MSDTPDTTFPSISPAELQSQLDAKTAFVIDIRMKASGEQIPASRQYDPKQLTSADPLVLPIPHDGTTVVVDDRGEGKALHEVAKALASANYVDVRTLDGGYHGWTEAGLPVEELSMKQPVAGAADHQLFR